MKKFIGLALIAILLLTGCGASSTPTPSFVPSREPVVPRTITIEFSNASNYIFNEIYISPTASNEWGDELLGSTRILKSNGSVDIELHAYDYDNYDILVVDEDRDEYYFSRVSLQNGSEVAIYFGINGLAATVFDAQGNETSTVYGDLNSANGGGAGAVHDPAPDPAPAQTVTGTGYDTNGQYTFSVYNESSYDIYAIYMGVAGASAAHDIDILPQILSSGDGIELRGMASQGDWLNTEWTLYITDVDGDTSSSFDTFNPWIVSYVDIYWNSSVGGYVCEFFY